MTKKQDVITLLSAFVCVLFLTFAQMSGTRLLIMAALVLYLAILVVAREAYVIPLMLFFLPWSTIMKLSPDSISFCSIGLLLVFVLNCLFRGNRKFLSSTVISVAGILAVTLISILLNNYGISASYIMFIAMLVAYPLFVYWMKDSVDFETCILYYSLGIISATVIAFIFADNSNLLAYIQQFEDVGNVVRHCGFYSDPNFYAAQVMGAIGGELLIINKKRKNSFWNIVITIALVICGATSISKSYLLCLAILVTVWLYCQMKKGAGKIVKVLLVVTLVIIVVLASGAFSEIIDQYLFRFGKADDASSLTTGRSDLWMEYFNFFVNNPLDLFIGQGYTSIFKEGVHKASHNTIIQCVYQFGVLGCVFLVSGFGTFVVSAGVKKIKPSYVVLLLVACFSMWMGLDLLFFDDLFLTIVVFVMGMRYASRAENKNIFD